MCRGSRLGSGDTSNFTVPKARAVVGGGFRALEARKQEINDLNVYPVPDGDTGTNLSLTLKSVVDELLALPDDLTPAELAPRIASAALMGARGNSGVILSQMVRGAMEVLGRDEPFSDLVLAAALQEASESAYRAIRKPVDGTMLTVLGDMAAAAAEMAGSEDRATLLEHLLHSGWDSVRRTPALLKVLADAGVVDAGGFGLVILLEGLIAGIEGEEVRAHPAGAGLARAERRGGEEPESRYTYCTTFLLQGEGLDRAALEEALTPLGDSLLVVGDSAQLKVHIHTDEPGRVLSLGTGRGVLEGIEIDNMKTQTAARGERLRELAEEAGLTQVVAVVAGEGNRKLFASLGADFLVEGGQSMNPSAEELLQAVRRTTAPAVVILPNNRNIILAAEQIVGLTDKELHVVPTRSLQAGLSALVAYERGASGRENAAAMEEAQQGLSAGEVTWAVRDSCVDGFEIREGSFIGLVDERVVAAGGDFRTVVERVAERLIDGDREILTVLVGNTGLAGEAREVVESLRERYGEVDIEVHEGGQPLYPLLFSAE